MEQRCSSFMSISLAILLSVLFAFAWSANARKDSGDYWKGVMKDEPMPVALEALILPDNDPSKSSSRPLVKKSNCYHDDVIPLTTTLKDSQVEDDIKKAASDHDFEPRPSVTAYVREQGTTTKIDDEEAANYERPLFKSFEPRPNVSSYHDGNTVVVVVEQKPHVSDDGMPVVVDSFEPRPNVSTYGN